MGRLFIDISELANWQGKLTGVPRVMNELSRRFAKNDNCQFVSWAAASGHYIPIDFNTVGADSTPPVQTITSSKGLIGATKKLRARSKLVDKALIIPTKVARKALRPNPPEEVSQQMSPQKGDTLFILADWHSDQGFVDYVTQLKESGVHLVQISYDLLPIVTPQYSGHATDNLTRYTKAIYPICDLIFAISQHTKKDITAWLKKNKLHVPPIEVMRLGDDFELAKPTKPTDKNFVGESTKDFILCVGTIEARKNHTLLYYVYKLARQKDIDLPKLVIVGRRGWKTDDVFEIMSTDPETKDQFVFLQNTSDEELAWLYKHAQFSIYPSFYEGWGLPIAESIAYGVPSIASNTSSMPEIAGDLINYFSPLSTEECLNAIVAMLKPGAVKEAQQKIKAYRPTSWDSTFDFVKKHIGGKKWLSS